MPTPVATSLGELSDKPAQFAAALSKQRTQQRRCKERGGEGAGRRAGNGQKWCVCARYPIWARSQNESEENKNGQNVEERSLDPEPVGRFHGNLPTSSSVKRKEKKKQPLKQEDNSWLL